MDESKRENAVAAMRQINQAWLKGRVEDLAPLVHSEIVMFFSDFAGRFRAGKTLLPGSVTFAKTRPFMNSMSTISRSMSPETRL